MLKTKMLGKRNLYKVMAEIQEIEFYTTVDFLHKKIYTLHQKI